MKSAFVLLLPLGLLSREVLIEFFVGALPLPLSRPLELSPLSGLRSQFLLGCAIRERFPAIFGRPYSPHAHSIFSTNDDFALQAAQAHLLGEYLPSPSAPRPFDQPTSPAWAAFSQSRPDLFYLPKAPLSESQPFIPAFYINRLPYEESGDQASSCPSIVPGQDSALLARDLLLNRDTFLPLLALLDPQSPPKIGLAEAKERCLLEVHRAAEEGARDSGVLPQCEALLAFFFFLEAKHSRPKDLINAKILGQTLAFLEDPRSDQASPAALSFALSAPAFAQILVNIIPHQIECIIENFPLIAQGAAEPRPPCLTRIRPSTSLVIAGDDASGPLAYFLNGEPLDDRIPGLLSPDGLRAFLEEESQIPLPIVCQATQGDVGNSWFLGFLYFASLAGLAYLGFQFFEAWRSAGDNEARYRDEIMFELIS